MSKHTSISLTDDQRPTLQTLIHAGKVRARTYTRARILLLLDQNQAAPFRDDAVAQALGCHRNTGGNVRRRFLAGGWPAALYDKPLPPRMPLKITGEVEAHLIALACSAPPTGQQRWTLRLLADRLVELGLVDSISHVAIGERLKNTL
jgi:hypothetical protein